ncbi:cytochrome P450 89A2-like isoform X2 [Quercus robur]|uniref:cytochrome P450 89A2-like isoform X2 n=1 Tax=Quercus robur TaxID=38942 RepID=UPI002161E811|nr:cytochrome P450 89A2-like isoform X2 [Quercus robur]
MEVWFIIIISLCISALLKSLLFNKVSENHSKIPPGPLHIPILSNFLWLRKPFIELELTLRKLHAKYGPIITIYIGFNPAIFVANRSLAHKALIQNSAVFADRPAPPPTDVIVSSNKHNINTASYGPTWRLFRRNLTSEILHPSRMKSYSHARKWVLDILLNRLRSNTESVVKDHFQYSMFCLLVLMCFGDKLGETQIRKIEEVERRLLLSSRRFAILNFFPRIGRILFRKRWEELFQLRRNQDDVLIPLIKARRKVKQERQSKMKEDKENDDEFVVSYVDTLLDLELPEEKRKLEDKEMVNLCSEFLDAGTDTTSTALEWIMANMVKYPQIQERLLVEIKGVVGDGEKEVKEEDLNKIPYLKAVVLEGLRRHPPGHFVLPHAVTEDVVLDGYLIPKNATLNFMVAEMGWDSRVWEDPMEFKPERFLSGDDGGGEAFDITGSREIKMMPFGAGRRICPASGLAILHLEYFVANLVSNFEWKAVDGDEVDLSEKHEFTMVMKNPLKAHLSPRF